MAPAPLTSRALGRALLARQLLVRRARMPVRDALEHLVGLQAQAPLPPYVALWTRLDGFAPHALSALVEGYGAVRIGLMRGTLHLVTDRDAVQLRPLTQPVFERTLRANYGARLADTDVAAVVRAAREVLADGPRTPGELGAALHERWPGTDPHALSMAARYLLPLVQLPPRGLWGRSGRPVLDDVERRIGRSLTSEPCVETLLLRYLGAFGPASVQDAQTWSGLTRLAEVVERLRPQLRVFTDEAGRELFDLPDTPRPDADLPLPARFLAEYDSLVLAHADRTRLMDEATRRALVSRNGQVPGTFLLDGRVSGTWRTLPPVKGRKKGKAPAGLELSPLRTLTDEEQRELSVEGERLLAFLSDGAPGPHTVTFAPPAAPSATAAAGPRASYAD
ncbi:hypothetical protein DEH18_04845 [Streptomyces sp. NHF165]|uniref:winged helix DNA-binding domain-containing protein n=1 Tax=Streptomyces sp. NHF165 TaxID=2175864 RepID=UPI00132F29D0|nr:winged helix DNA-binding domain-containing protein [Streptomyces sp. NHF165]QHF93327.1 hypothetical protein DEH18_04845 [Streptomyces sp. NHF165]